MKKLMVVPFDAYLKSEKIDHPLIFSVWKICFCLVTLGYFDEEGNSLRGQDLNVFKIIDILFNKKGYSDEYDPLFQ